MKIVLCFAILATSVAWAEEAADRAAVEATISALNSSQSRPELFTADFPNAVELQRFRQAAPSVIPSHPGDGAQIQTEAGTLVISKAPMGEATWYPGVGAIAPRFVTRSVTFVSPDIAVVVAVYGRESVLFVMKNESSNWRIASFRVIPEAQTKVR